MQIELAIDRRDKTPKYQEMTVSPQLLYKVCIQYPYLKLPLVMLQPICGHCKNAIIPTRTWISSNNTFYTFTYLLNVEMPMGYCLPLSGSRN